MKFPLHCFPVLALIIVLTGCSVKNDPPRETARDPVRQQLMDSLAICDSLAYKYRVQDVALSFSFAGEVVRIARSINTPYALAKSYITLGNTHNAAAPDSSFLFYGRAKRIADSAGITDLQPLINYDLALLYTKALNYKPALTFYDLALRQVAVTGNNALLSDIYNSLGTVYLELSDSSTAKKMLTTAYDIAKKNGLKRRMGVAMGNLSNLEKDTELSIRIQHEAIRYLEDVPGAEEELASELVNLGNKHPDPDSAILFFREAMNVTSPANLPEVFFGANNSLAYCFMEKGDLRAAQSCLIDKAIPLAVKTGNHDWLATLYDSYADVLFAMGKYRETGLYEKEALNSRIIADGQKSSAQVRLLAAMLDLNRKEAMIKTNELELQQQRMHVQNLTFWLIVAGLIILVTVMALAGLRLWSKLKIDRERLSATERIIAMEENEKGRFARELHDTIGYVVQGLAGHIEKLAVNDPEISNSISARLKEIGESIRRISHRLNRVMTEKFSFEELITGLCEDMEKYTGMQITLSLPRSLPRFSNEMTLQTYRIIQELLNNAAKYARHSAVSVNVALTDNTLILIYNDNGPGFVPDQKKESGLGILNIFERVKLLKGTAELASEPGKGTTWEFILPARA